MTTSDVGAASELAIAADLLKKGWKVYRNLSPVGLTDLVIERDGKLYKVQVKSSKGASYEEKLTNDLIAVAEDGKITYFRATPTSIKGTKTNTELLSSCWTKNCDGVSYDGEGLCELCTTHCSQPFEHSRKTMEGLVKAKEGGTALGRPRINVSSAQTKELLQNGLSYRQIATTLGVSPATVCNRLKEQDA